MAIISRFSCCNSSVSIFLKWRTLQQAAGYQNINRSRCETSADNSVKRWANWRGNLTSGVISNTRERSRFLALLEMTLKHSSKLEGIIKLKLNAKDEDSRCTWSEATKGLLLLKIRTGADKIQDEGKSYMLFYNISISNVTFIWCITFPCWKTLFLFEIRNNDPRYTPL